MKNITEVSNKIKFPKILDLLENKFFNFSKLHNDKDNNLEIYSLYAYGEFSVLKYLYVGCDDKNTLYFIQIVLDYSYNHYYIGEIYSNLVYNTNNWQLVKSNKIFQLNNYKPVDILQLNNVKILKENINNNYVDSMKLKYFCNKVHFEEMLNNGKCTI